MEAVFDFTDDLGPAKVVHVHEPTTRSTTVRLSAVAIVLRSSAAGRAHSPVAPSASRPVKAAYFSCYGIAAPAIRDLVFALLGHTELDR
jgi:hypothetical protein